MARKPRLDIPGRAYHVINRSVGRLQLFNEPQDYKLFLNVLMESWEIHQIDIYAFCIMPNHFHMLVRPKEVGDLQKFMHYLSSTYTRRLHIRTNTNGCGPVFQGRYKAIMVQDGKAFETIFRYIELNSVRAKLVQYSDEWEWCSSNARINNTKYNKILANLYEEIPSGSDLRNWIHGFMYEDALENIRVSINKGRPFGDNSWVELMCNEHDLLYTMRVVGRPRLLNN